MTKPIADFSTKEFNKIYVAANNLFCAFIAPWPEEPMR